MAKNLATVMLSTLMIAAAAAAAAAGAGVVVVDDDGIGGDRKVRWNSRSTVRVKSAITGNHLLTAHCKSADDDIGVRKLSYGQKFDWSFSDVVFGNTLFWCYMGWTDTNGKRKEASFEVYNAEKESCRYAECLYEYTADNHGVSEFISMNSGEYTETRKVLVWPK